MLMPLAEALPTMPNPLLTFQHQSECKGSFPHFCSYCSTFTLKCERKSGQVYELQRSISTLVINLRLFAISLSTQNTVELSYFACSSQL